MTIHYAYSIKALPAAPPEDAPTASPPEEPQPPAHDDARPWAGDAYDGGDETDPAAAFARFAGTDGTDGEEAWLDRAPDGTLTGWVRDRTGQVWRYSDDRAWALDVDRAQMQRVGAPHSDNAPSGTPGTARPGSGEVPDPSSDSSANEPPADAPALEDDVSAAADEAVDVTGLDAADPNVGESTDDPQDDQDDDPDVPFPGARKPKKKGAK